MRASSRARLSVLNTVAVQCLHVYRSQSSIDRAGGRHSPERRPEAGTARGVRSAGEREREELLELLLCRRRARGLPGLGVCVSLMSDAIDPANESTSAWSSELDDHVLDRGSLVSRSCDDRLSTDSASELPPCNESTLLPKSDVIASISLVGGVSVPRKPDLTATKGRSR